MAGMNMSCAISDPPSIELSDSSLALRRAGDTYVQEWAIYPFHSDHNDSCTDFYCFVNAQRHDMGSDRITMQRTGFLGPGDSRGSDLSIYEGSGCECLTVYSLIQKFTSIMLAHSVSGQHLQLTHSLFLFCGR